MKRHLISLMFALVMCQSAAFSSDVIEPQPLSFKEKHPIAYRRFRKVRHVCVLVAPIVNVTANVFTAVGVFF